MHPMWAFLQTINEMKIILKIRQLYGKPHILSNMIKYMHMQKTCSSNILPQQCQLQHPHLFQRQHQDHDPNQ